MKKLLTFSFIGGDLRQLYVISALAKSGFHIKVYGFFDEHKNFADNVCLSDSVSSCVSGADVIVLPLPYSTDMGKAFDKQKINSPLFDKPIYVKDVIENADRNTVIFAGKVDKQLESLTQTLGIRTFDYSLRDELAIMNAIPTAEGALEIAMANTPFTLNNSRCLVIGYGRIGKILSSDLKALGAKVTATARRHSDLALISANGIDSLHTSAIDNNICDFDIVFNTVPHKVLDFNALSKTKEDVLIIDLASKPGGVDFDIAKELDRQVIWALSLPGKVAPLTAGQIIKDTLINILEELEV